MTLLMHVDYSEHPCYGVMTLFSADHLGKQKIRPCLKPTGPRSRGMDTNLDIIVNSNLVLDNQLHCWASKVPKMPLPHWFPYVTL